MGRWLGWWPALLGACVLACGGRSQYRGDGDGGGEAGPGSGGEDSPSEVPSCADHRLNERLGTVATGDSRGAPAGTGTSCSQGMSYHEVTFEWRAPATATYRIDTRLDAFNAFSFDTVLGLRAPGCPGVELACNDDYQDRTSAIVREFQAGERAVIVLYSLSPDAAGPYQLNIEELSQAACPYATVFDGQLPTAGREFDNPCGGGGPAATMALPLGFPDTIAVHGRAFAPVIQLRESCDGPVIACAASEDGEVARLSVPSLLDGESPPVLVIQRSDASKPTFASFRIDLSP